MGLFLLVAMSIVPFSMESFGLSQTLADEVEVPFRGGDTALRFLLESMQNVDCLGVADRIDPTPRVAAVVRHDFKHGSCDKADDKLNSEDKVIAILKAC
jgi:hypothetical protein